MEGETLEEKRAKAIEYLRSRGKYVLDGKFTPTPYTVKVDILKKYGSGMARPGTA